MFDIERMEKILNEPFYTVPRGLTREERRAYMLAIHNEVTKQEEIVTALSVLQQEAEQQ